MRNLDTKKKKRKGNDDVLVFRRATHVCAIFGNGRTGMSGMSRWRKSKSISELGTWKYRIIIDSKGHNSLPFLSGSRTHFEIRPREMSPTSYGVSKTITQTFVPGNSRAMSIQYARWLQGK